MPPQGRALRNPPSARAAHEVLAALGPIALLGLISLSCNPTDLSDGGLLLDPSNPDAVPVDPCPAPPFLEFPVRINEVMLHNVAAFPDEKGAFSPWIELYNATADEIYLGGATLSDDPADEAKWEIPCVPDANIGPGGYFIIFLDGDVENPDDFHASFSPKVGVPVTLILNGGSDIVLIQNPPPEPDVSLGRFPDGEPGSVILLDAPSPGEPNSATLPVTFVRGDVDEDGTVAEADLTLFLELTHDGPGDFGCADRLDVNDDGEVDISDGSLLARAIAPGGPPIPAPYPDPGVDPTPDELPECVGATP